VAGEGGAAERERLAIERMYLGAPDAYGQSGFQGDAARWEALRRPVMKAVDRAGSFLDIGCANGLLLESASKWAAEDGHRIDVFGLDHSAALAERAKARLGVGADRVFVGDAMTWEPPRRFDFVRTELVYVPGARRLDYVRRLTDAFLESGGRLIVASYGTRGGVPPAEPVGDWMRSSGFDVLGEAEGVDPWSGKVLTRVAWAAANTKSV
jgi:SAM-dependent methyltransferase